MAIVLDGTAGITTPPVTVTNTIGVGGTTPSSSGAGVSFPATQSASTNVNTLDDYEEGTWTPTDGSGAGLTFTIASGFYTKIGRVVQFTIYVSYPTTVDASPAKIGSFPFAFPNDNAARGNAVAAFSNYSLAIGLLNDTGGVTTSRFYASAGGTSVTNANLSTATIYLGGTYITST